MPWTLNVPLTSPWAPLDTVLVTGFIVDNDNRTVRINYDLGYMEEEMVEDGEGVPQPVMVYRRAKPAQSYDVVGDAFITAVMQKPDGNLPYYENLKVWCYDQLHANGVIGDGVLS